MPVYVSEVYISEDVNKTNKSSCIRKNYKTIYEVIVENYFKESKVLVLNFLINVGYIRIHHSLSQRIPKIRNNNWN